MGCTYSEEVDVTGMRAVVPVPILAQHDDPAIVGAPLPLEVPLDQIGCELALEIHPPAWYGGRAPGFCVCHTSVQGVHMGHFELATDRTSVIVYPVVTSAIDTFTLVLTFLDAKHWKLGTIRLTVPAYAAEHGEVKIDRALDIIETPTSGMIRTASGIMPAIALTIEEPTSGSSVGPMTGAVVGRVAVSISFTPHNAADKIHPRLKLQYVESGDISVDGAPSRLDSSLLRACSSVGPGMLSSPERIEARRIPLRAIMAGIRQAATACSNPKVVLSSADFGREASVKFSLENGAVEMKVFSPQAFSSIRAMDGISPEQYQREWDLPEKKLVLDLGAGRSGSLFLRSNTNRYILKTIPHAEVCTFLSLLESYHNHLATSPDSFIMHVHGLHRFYWAGNWLYVILFSNILFSTSPLPVHIFDLKGRVAKPGKLMARRHEKGIVWKDKDLERFFFLPQAANDSYRRQLAADVAFLASHNMMDYSLLVGVRERPADYVWQEAHRDRSFFRSWMGGTPGTEECQEVYYIGIIDCLTQYNSKKKVANFCKQMLWRHDTLSTVPSKDYGDRFLKFMYAIFPTEQEVKRASLKHPNLAIPIAALDTLNLNRNQVASPIQFLNGMRSSGSDLSMQDTPERLASPPPAQSTAV